MGMMTRSLHKRISFAKTLGLSPEHAETVARLATPEDIQDFLTSLSINHEPQGDTCLSAQSVLEQKHAHCIEAAFVAATALWCAGRPPLLMDMQATDDDADHVVTLFRAHGCWGAISKSNHVFLRWRDPVYRTLRELAMSYFHEYANAGKKTLRTYSASFDLRRFESSLWVTNKESCWEIAGALDASRHYRLLTRAQSRALKMRDRFEIKAENLVEYRAP